MEYRTIEAGEVEAFLGSLYRAFGEAKVDADEFAADQKVIEPDRTFAAIDDGEIVGCAGAITQRMVVSGGALAPTAGITVVGVLPTHRRMGILREFMRRLCAQAIERGEVLATLFASQAAIYGRFGFGHAAFHLTFDAALDRIAWVPGTEPTGRVRLQPREEGAGVIRAVYDRAYPGRPGALESSDLWLETAYRWHEKNEDGGFFAVHEDDDGTPDAFAMYRIKHEWPRGLPSSELNVHRALAATPQGGASLWRYLFEIDLMARVKVGARPLDDPLLLQLEEPRALRPELDDGLFLRSLDVAASLAARSYAGSGRVVLSVTDEFLPELGGAFELVVDADGATCRRVQDEPDVSCTARGLGSAYLGGATWSALAAAGLLAVHDPAALGVLDALFRADVAPWPMYYF